MKNHNEEYDIIIVFNNDLEGIEIFGLKKKEADKLWRDVVDNVKEKVSIGKRSWDRPVEFLVRHAYSIRMKNHIEGLDKEIILNHASETIKNILLKGD